MYLLLLLSHFSCVRLCATPETQPTRLPRPRDSPGNNTGVSCHFLLQCMKVKRESYLLLLPSIFPSIRVFSNESVLRIRWPKYWEFQPQHQSFQYIFRTDLLEDGLVGSPCSLRDSQESSQTAQFKSINSSVLSLLYGAILTFICDYCKNRSFD